MAGFGVEIGRVCPYARQQCTLAQGCVTHDGVAFGADPLDVEFRALCCEMRGALLFADELATGRLRTDENIVQRRRMAHLRRMEKLDQAMRDRREIAANEPARGTASLAPVTTEGT